MYNYDFENELVVFEKADCLISFNNKELISNILVTDKNILIFKNDVNPILKGREIHELPVYELIFKFDLNDIIYEVDEDNTIVKIAKSELILFNFDLNKVKNS